MKKEIEDKKYLSTDEVMDQFRDIESRQLAAIWGNGVPAEEMGTIKMKKVDHPEGAPPVVKTNDPKP